MILPANIWIKVKCIQSYPTKYIRDMKNYCFRIAPYVEYYKKQTDYYNWMTYEIITDELALIFQNKRDKRKVPLHLL